MSWASKDQSSLNIMAARQQQGCQQQGSSRRRQRQRQRRRRRCCLTASQNAGKRTGGCSQASLKAGRPCSGHRWRNLRRAECQAAQRRDRSTPRAAKRARAGK